MLRYETRNGNDVTDIPAEKYMQNNQYLFYLFCTTAGWWGNSVVFGQRSRLAGGVGAAILHN